MASMVRVGLSCAADLSKERFPLRETLSKLQEIKRLGVAVHFAQPQYSRLLLPHSSFMIQQ